MKNVKILRIFSFIFLFFAICLLFDAHSVDAFEYEFSGGEVIKEHKKVNVYSFKYDYITKFESDEIEVEGKLKDVTFYTGSQIVINVDEYSSWMPFKDDEDQTYIYKYDEINKNYEEVFKKFVDKKTTCTIDEAGVYKIVYSFEGEEIHVDYINIVENMHLYYIEADSKYENISALSSFSFNIKISDAYDLRKNKYYYAFGANASNLTYTEFSIFDEIELNSDAAIIAVDKDVSVEIKDSDTSINGEKKYLFVKVVKANGKEEITKTSGAYELASKIEAKVYLVDENGEVIENYKSYKKSDVINFKIYINAPVTYTYLQYSIDGVNFIPLNDSLKETTQINIEHLVQDNKNFGGAFKLQTKNNINAIVNHSGTNISLSVVNKTNFNIDIAAPNIEVLDDGDVNGRKDYTVTIDVEEDNLKEVMYYAAKCSTIGGSRCLDRFNNDNDKIVNLGAAINPSVKIDSQFGLFNGENLALFVKAVDNAGNEKTFVKWGYVIDNVVVPENEVINIFGYADIKDGNTVVGKQLTIDVLNKYNVVSVEYKLVGDGNHSCNVSNSTGDSVQYSCLKIEGYDFNSNVIVYLKDSFNNVEEYEINFRYSMVKEGNIVVDGKTFNLYGNKEYEIEFKKYNFMNKENDSIVFGEDVFKAFEEELNLSKVPDVKNITISLVYFNEEEEIVVEEDVSGEFTVPSIEELLKVIGHLDKFKNCGVDRCNIEVYLKYEYTSKNIPQTRLIKLNFIDSSNKFFVGDDYNPVTEIKVGEVFRGFEFKYRDNLNVNIQKENVVVSKKIMYEDAQGVLVEVSSVDTTKLGKYSISETFEYGAVGSFPIYYEVTVVDKEAPIIRLNGKEKIVLNVGDEFIDPMAVANDNYDLNLEIKFKVDKEIDVNVPGEYIISYWCEDSSGNVSEIITRTVVFKAKNDISAYLISGGIALVTIVIVVVGTCLETKKCKRKK